MLWGGVREGIEGWVHKGTHLLWGEFPSSSKALHDSEVMPLLWHGRGQGSKSRALHDSEVMELCSVRALLCVGQLCFALICAGSGNAALFGSTAAAHCESFGLSAAAGSKALVQAESVNQTRIIMKTHIRTC